MEVALNNSDKKVIIDDEDFDKVSFTGWFLFYKKKNRKKEYVKSTKLINGKQVTIHRYILSLTDPNICVDHNDGNTLNNQKSNLRICSIAENNRNKSSHSIATSKYLGVFKNKNNGKWFSCLYFNGKTVFRKQFDDEIEAAKAYNEQALKYFGEFSNINKF